MSQALSSATALQELENLRPDLVVLGPHLEEAEAFTLSREITLRVPDSKVVIFTARMDDPLFQADAAYVGIGACLSRIMSDEECLAIIANVVTGHQSFSPEILTLAFQSIRLTRRECDVLRFMAGGKTDQEIASALGLKPSIIRNHSQHILEKFDVHERREAVRRARRRGWV